MEDDHVVLSNIYIYVFIYIYTMLRDPRKGPYGTILSTKITLFVDFQAMST